MEIPNHCNFRHPIEFKNTIHTNSLHTDIYGYCGYNLFLFISDIYYHIHLQAELFRTFILLPLAIQVQSSLSALLYYLLLCAFHVNRQILSWKSLTFTSWLYHVSGMRHDSNLALPIRQTASIFKQPVTVIRNHNDSVTKTDLKHGPQEPPKQVIWK